MGLLKRIFGEPKFVSWYVEPGSRTKVYLCGEQNGYWYSRDKRNAKRFDTFGDAMEPTPTYDGSPKIERRTGVELVWSRK